MRPWPRIVILLSFRLSIFLFSFSISFLSLSFSLSSSLIFCLYCSVVLLMSSICRFVAFLLRRLYASMDIITAAAKTITADMAITSLFWACASAAFLSALFCRLSMCSVCCLIFMLSFVAKALSSSSDASLYFPSSF